MEEKFKMTFLLLLKVHSIFEKKDTDMLDFKSWQSSILFSIHTMMKKVSLLVKMEENLASLKKKQESLIKEKKTKHIQKRN